MSKSANVRFSELDGIRGWAALSVALYHICWETLGILFPQYRNIVTSTLMNGSLSVSIFFVLSGEVLSASYWLNQSIDNIKKMAKKRYFRLTIPIFFSCLLTYLAINLDITFNKQASFILQNENWLGQFLSHVHGHFSEFLSFSLWNVYFKNPASQSYNPFLWTMGIELLGSYLIFAYIFLHHFKKVNSWLSLFIFWIIAYAADPNLSCFVSGLIIGKLRMQSHFNQKINQKFVNLFILSLFILSGYLQVSDKGDRWHFVLISPLLLFAIHQHSDLTNFFKSKLSLYLGKISFPIYLTHFFVIATFTSWSVIYLNNNSLLNFTNSLFIALASFAIAFILAIQFLHVEKFTKFFESLLIKK